MSYKILYYSLVVKEDIPRLDSKIKNRVKKAIENKLMINPKAFSLPLKYPLNGLYKLRVGDWRIIFEVKKETVNIVAVRHRSKVYENLV